MAIFTHGLLLYRIAGNIVRALVIQPFPQFLNRIVGTLSEDALGFGGDSLGVGGKESKPLLHRVVDFQVAAHRIHHIIVVR